MKNDRGPHDLSFSREPSPNSSRPQEAIGRFLQCFTISGRHKQIRIMQMGASGPISIWKKPLSTSQPMKNSERGLFNNEILHATKLRTPNSRRQSEQMRDSYRFRCSNLKSSGPNRSYENSDSMRCTDFLSSSFSPKKMKAPLNKRLEELPNKFFKKSYSENPQIKTERNSGFNYVGEVISKSVNLINKAAVDDERNWQEDAKPATIKLKRKEELDPRKAPQAVAEDQRKAKLQKKRKINQEYAKPFVPPNNVTATSYVIFRPDLQGEAGVSEHLLGQQRKKYPHSHKVLASLNSRASVEVASLTKIMTCILGIQICEKYQVDAESERIIIGRFESNIGGTSAQISEGEVYKLKDLFYGLMLPSGNDASVAIAVWGGKLLLSKQVSISNLKKKQFYNHFIGEMNAAAKRIGLLKTCYANSHGLVNSSNRSCAYDLAILCEYAMKNPTFRSIVSCRLYQTKISCLISPENEKQFHPSPCKSLEVEFREREGELIEGELGKGETQQREDEAHQGEEDAEQEQGEAKGLDSEEQIETNTGAVESVKTVRWENTHRLLQQKPDEYVGIKTGITTAAGPCLASCIKLGEKGNLIIIVLNCGKMSMRFKDTETLKKWVLQRERASSKRQKRKDGGVESELARN